MKNICIMLNPLFLSCSNDKIEVISSRADMMIQQMAGNLLEAEVNDKLNALMECKVHALKTGTL